MKRRPGVERRRRRLATKLETMIENWVNDGVDVNLESLVDIVNGKIYWKSNQSLAAIPEKIQKEIIKLKGNVNISTLKPLMPVKAPVTPETIGAFSDAAGRFFEYWTAEYLFQLYKNAGADVEEQFSDQFLNQKNTDLDLESQKQIRTAAENSAKSIFSGNKSNGKIQIISLAGSDARGDILLKLGNKEITFELKFITSMGNRLKYFTLTNPKNFEGKMSFVDFISKNPVAEIQTWKTDVSILDHDTWVSNVRQVITDYTVQVLDGELTEGSPSKKNLALFKYLLAKGGETSALTKKKLVIGNYSDPENVKMSVNLNILASKKAEKDGLFGVRNKYSFSITNQQAALANLTAEVESISSHSIDKVKGDSPDWQTMTILLYLQKGFYD